MRRLPASSVVAWVLAYLLLFTLVVWGMFYARSAALTTYGSAEAQAEWDTWREDAKGMSEGPGPVKRRPPKSAAPPALVLMRDHFGVCLTLAVVLSTILFGTFMFFVRGAMAQAAGGREDTPPAKKPPAETNT